MRIDLRQLDGEAFDVVVVGAGIQGAALAREASARGLSTLLLDARDVAAGTSSRSSQLVHGGLRYLRHGHLALVREALFERERLLRLAPHLVRPLPMLMPFYQDSGVARWKMRLGTWLYSKLAGGSTLPRPRSLSAQAAVDAFPGLRTNGLRSAIEFYDARTQDGRLCILDWGLVTRLDSDLRLTLIEHVAHIVAREYEKLPADLVRLGFVPAGAEVPAGQSFLALLTQKVSAGHVAHTTASPSRLLYSPVPQPKKVKGTAPEPGRAARCPSRPVGRRRKAARPSCRPSRAPASRGPRGRSRARRCR
mgnify:CR=1 FL=1